MTYCVGMLLDEGFVFLSDSRTNAGVDQINTFRKMSVFEKPEERILVLLTSGNLAITQSLISMLQEAITATDGRPSLMNTPNMFEAARLIGDTLRDVHRRDAEALAAFNIEFSASFILGGQIKGETGRLFSIYAAGNFIEATPETPYFQIGESKYGKPIIDRVLRPHTPLDEAAKCALISMDSTIRSNLSVGLPLDLLTIHADTLKIAHRQSIDAGDSYYEMIRNGWSNALRHAFDELPNPQL